MTPCSVMTGLGGIVLVQAVFGVPAPARALPLEAGRA